MGTVEIQPQIQPQELRFIFELKKQCSRSVRLVNKTNQHLAFKVKTTSPKKYCVRPNTGVLNPKAICDCTVTMQAQKVIPPDMTCKDKFLVQWATVSAGTTKEDITSATFAKDGKYVQEKKLRVILVSPPNFPVIQDVKESKFDAAEDSKPVIIEITEELMLSKDVVHEKKDDIISKTVKDMEELKVVKDIGQKLLKEIEEVKSKIREFESKLIEAERTISKLTEEKRLNTQDRKNLQQELFAKDGQYVEEKKLRVQSYDVSIPEDQNPNSIENFSLPQTVRRILGSFAARISYHKQEGSRPYFRLLQEHSSVNQPLLEKTIS